VGGEGDRGGQQVYRRGEGSWFPKMARTLPHVLLSKKDKETGPTEVGREPGLKGAGERKLHPPFPFPHEHGSTVRVPKGFRALGLQGSRAKKMQGTETEKLELHGCTLGLHLARISILCGLQEEKGFGPRAPWPKIRGFQGSEVPPLRP